MNQTKYLLQSLDPAAFTIIDSETRTCYILMANCVMTDTTNVQVTLINVTEQLENSRYAIAEREVFTFRLFASSWDQVESVLKEIMEAILLYELDLELPLLLGEVFGGWINGEVAMMPQIDQSEIH